MEGEVGLAFALAFALARGNKAMEGEKLQLP
jgi:hypothetical protein